MKTKALALFLVAAAFTTAPLTIGAADAENPAEARLRETLKATIAELRTAENDRANLQATQTDLEQKNKDLAEQVKLLVKQSAADKSAADKAAETLKARLAQQGEEIARLKEMLAQAQAENTKAVAVIHVGDEKGARLAADNGVLQRRVAELEAKNRELFKLGNDILTRYAKFSLGDALAAREPFVGATRTKLENLVQDLQEQMREQRATP